MRWKMACNQKTEKFHDLIHAQAQLESYWEGSTYFFTTSRGCLSSAEYCQNAEKYARKLQRQQEAWPEVWLNYTELLKSATKHFGGKQVYLMEMETMMKAAMNMGHMQAQKSKLQTAYKLILDLTRIWGSEGQGCCYYSCGSCSGSVSGCCCSRGLAGQCTGSPRGTTGGPANYWRDLLVYRLREICKD
jgi:hypothetical protein